MTELGVTERYPSLGEGQFLLPVSFRRALWYFYVWLIIVLVVIGCSAFIKMPLVATWRGQITLLEVEDTLVSNYNGVVSDVFVGAGLEVHYGQPLLQVRSFEFPTEESLYLEIQFKERELSLLSSDMDVLHAQSNAVTAQFEQQQAALTEMQLSNQSSISIMELQLAESQEDVVLSRSLKEAGIISEGILRQKINSLQILEEELAQLLEIETSLTRRIALASQSAEREKDIIRAQQRSLEIQIANLMAEIQNLRVSHVWEIVAPRSGIVASVVATTGSSVSPGGTLASIRPMNGIPRVVFYQASTTPLTLERGSEVKVTIDAFPVQEYGTFPASLVEVGRSPDFIPPEVVTLGVPSTQSFRHIAELKIDDFTPEIETGYTVSVSSLIRTQSLLQWLTSPFWISLE